jgi:hypothetical protein
MKALLLSILMIYATPVEAKNAKTVITCDESLGFMWFFPSKVITEPGWSEDKVKGGKITLTKDEKGYDLHVTRAGKYGFSARNNGKITYVGGLNPFIFTVVYYGGIGPTVEAYTFKLYGNKRADLTLTRTRATGFLDTSSIFHAKCKVW